MDAKYLVEIIETWGDLPRETEEQQQKVIEQSMNGMQIGLILGRAVARLEERIDALEHSYYSNRHPHDEKP